MKRRFVALLALFFGCLIGMGAMPAPSGQLAPPRPATPIEPISAILNAFQSHNIVALGEPHGNEQAHAFRLALIRDPRFALTVNDIVWECGTARYQDTMDRFITGEDIPDALLRQTWGHTVGSIGFNCDLPIYEEFIRAVRSVNASLTRERQLRVLLGDPPIEWESVHTVPDLIKWVILRDKHASDAIQREVLGKKRRALIIYGDMHLRRKHMGANYMVENPRTKAPMDGRTLTELLEGATSSRVFTISFLLLDPTSDVTKLQADIASWPIPSMTMLRGTVLGATDFSFYLPGSRDPARPMEDKFDALIYLGPPSAMSQARLSSSVCADEAYMQEHYRRMALTGQPADGVKKYCASVLAK